MDGLVAPTAREVPVMGGPVVGGVRAARRYS